MTSRQTKTTPENVEVTVAICTYQRPEGLARLLRSLTQLDSESPSFDVVVVDNDRNDSARSSIDQADIANLQIRFFVEPVQSIARARNKSVDEATGRYIAFIDDDEWVHPRWLIELHEVATQTRAAGVFGPVETILPDMGSNWIRHGDFFRREALATGQQLAWWQTSTSNTLVLKSAMESTGKFDETFGLTGGEDCELFHRMLGLGLTLVGSDRGLVYESYPASRARASWLLKRHYRNGMISQRIKPQSGRVYRFCRELAASAWCGITNRQLGFRHLLRSASALGELAAAFGFTYKPYKNSDDKRT